MGIEDGRPKPPEENVEKIRAAAVEYKGEVYEGPTHWHAMLKLKEKYPDIVWFKTEDGFLDGFVTSNGRFVDRNEANRVASSADQIHELDKDRNSLSAEWFKDKK